MNFLGIDVTGLDLPSFFSMSRALYVGFFLLFVAAVWKGFRLVALAGPLGLALGCWLMASFPLPGLYGLAESTDRIRNLSWCATVAAGNGASESGIFESRSFEPAWSLFVAALSLWEPSRVVTLYAILPALALVFVGLSLIVSFLGILPDDGLERPGADDRLRLALWVGFFALLASVGPLDFLNPYRGFWAKTFLLKPNHALAFAFVPVVAALLGHEMNRRRTLVLAGLLGVMGYAFITYWALLCFGLFLYGVSELRSKRREALLLAAALASSVVLVAPYIYFLVARFPATVSFETGAFEGDPLMSVWGDTPSRTHSMFFLVTFDLGVNFYLMLYALWTSWRRSSRFDRALAAIVLGAYLAFAASCYLLFTGRARQSDEVYFFLVFVVAVSAGLGAYRLVERLRAVWKPALEPRRMQAGALVLLLPLSLGWWWDLPRMDAHFRMGLTPIPWELDDVGQWLRDHTKGTDVVLAYGPKALYVPALTGRRILFAENAGQVEAALERKIPTHAVLARGESLDVAGATLDVEYQAGETRIYSIRYGENE